ncbi:Fatty acid oxidation complex subunit alpha [Maioricimonas rarisocia]|uniref:enoyl-CoA hydratase n=1 Tax=Maioricimonas rarisocia TaxID=2528026 RepID=A0A517ZAJ3_9PLAN|nr:3-hydroxyacyl-CoA dehydrogenase NAD-binding domain-containing protein [Maioricimonas rarisocia]QDU39512.1 Fatty acid oxidation complex subunit alpha [Maioricimonas rarisocia]
MSQYEHLRIKRDERGVATVAIDVRGRSMNVFNSAVMGELDRVAAQLEQDETAKLVIFRSGKESGFMAGADLVPLREMTRSGQIDGVLREGQDLFNRIAALPMPTVAAIHGPCLGGGLEFALACDHRVARRDSSTRIGLPETQLGLIPGWGGTQRLPRCIGVSAAIRMILTGERVSAARAKQLGLVDVVCERDHFDEGLLQLVDELLAGKRPTGVTPGWRTRLLDETLPGRKLVLWSARRQIARKGQHYPALPAALNAVAAGLSHGMTAGLAAEREEFSRIVFEPACRNLLNLFFQQERAKKRDTWVGSDVTSGHKVRTIAVVGAGTMGAGIAQLAATRGYSVILGDIDEAALDRGMEHIGSLTRNAVRKGVFAEAEGDAAIHRIRRTTELESLADADLVVEAIVERLDIKRKLFADIDIVVPAHTVIASNTSALPINEMAAATIRADRVAGLHFFNPVHKMPLVEVVRSARTSDETIADLVEVVRALGKTPLVVGEGPGFLVNRILFPYFDEAVRMVCEGLPVEQIDREARRFGLPMGPLTLLDTVGIDIGADASRTLLSLSAEASPTPERLSDMVAAGHLGQKSGEGFYTYRKGRRAGPAVKADASGQAVPLPETRELGGESLTGVQQRLVFALINSAADCLHEGIVAEPWMVDLGMVLGTGFPPFRGGPMKLAESWGTDQVIGTLNVLSETCGPRFRPSTWFVGERSPGTTSTAKPPVQELPH